MKIFLRISLVSSFIYLVGCSGGATDKINEENANATPVERTTPRTNQSPQNAGNNNNNANVAVNPPHGEPGHSCEIPVGAPLNADAGGASQAQPVQIQSQQQAPAQNSPKTGVAEGLNPPHGEPGHDCAIPVGAPLNK